MIEPAYVIVFAKGRMLGWNNAAIPPEICAGGYRPYVWTNQLIDAEKFGSEAAAALFGRGAIPHEEWSVVPVSMNQADCA